MRRFIPLIFIALALWIIGSGVFTVQETQQVIITQFGQPVGQPIDTAGLHFKMPLIQESHVLEKRILEWPDVTLNGTRDRDTIETPTRDKLYIVVNAFARWQIKHPLQFYLRLRDTRSAQSRLDDILGSEMRNTIARHDLVEIVRTTKDRKPEHDESIVAATGTSIGALPDIVHGRVALEAEVLKAATEKLADFGIELLDFRFKRINYNPSVAAKIYSRMASERAQIAERFRSEGAGEAAKISGQKERDLKKIDSEAYQKIQNIEGKADAEATQIYAKAFNGTAEAREFFTFLRTLETYEKSFLTDSTLILTTDSPLLKYLRGEPVSAAPGTRPIPPPTPIPPPLPPVVPPVEKP